MRKKTKNTCYIIGLIVGMILVINQQAFAYQLTVSGTVYNATDEQYQGNHPVLFYISEINIYDTVYTDAQGFYQITFDIQASDTVNFPVEISTHDLCFEELTWYFSFLSYPGNISNVDFTICYYSDDCYADFNTKELDDKTLHFYDNSYAYAGIKNWLWNFGDGTFSNQQSPIHTYQQAGQYTVSLTITSFDSCEASVYDFVNLSEPTTIYGEVFASGYPLPKGRVYAYTVEPSDSGMYLNFNSNVITNGTFTISYEYIQPNLLYVIPDFDAFDFYYPTFFPTYYHHADNDSAFYWENYDNYLVNTDTVATINLISYDTIFFGKGSISGTIDFTEMAYENATEISVLLLNSNFKPVKYTALTFDSFLFDHVPYGNYYALIDIIGLPCKPIPVSISVNNPNQQLNFTFNNDTLVENIPIQRTVNFRADPNPFYNNITLTLNKTTLEKTWVNIYAITGKLVYNRLLTDKTLNLQNLPSGAYILQVKNPQFFESTKIIKY